MSLSPLPRTMQPALRGKRGGGEEGGEEGRGEGEEGRGEGRGGGGGGGEEGRREEGGGGEEDSMGVSGDFIDVSADFIVLMYNKLSVIMSAMSRRWND